jgi:hypothetical protein
VGVAFPEIFEELRHEFGNHIDDALHEFRINYFISVTYGHIPKSGNTMLPRHNPLFVRNTGGFCSILHAETGKPKQLSTGCLEPRFSHDSRN